MALSLVQVVCVVLLQLVICCVSLINNVYAHPVAVDAVTAASSSAGALMLSTGVELSVGAVNSIATWEDLLAVRAVSKDKVLVLAIYGSSLPWQLDLDSRYQDWATRYADFVFLKADTDKPGVSVIPFNLRFKSFVSVLFEKPSAGKIVRLDNGWEAAQPGNIYTTLDTLGGYYATKTKLGLVHNVPKELPAESSHAYSQGGAGVDRQHLRSETMPDAASLAS